MPPNLFGHTTSGYKWGPHEVAYFVGKGETNGAKDTQFVLTQDRLPWLGLKAVETPSMSCESCQALSTLFPIAGARAANTAETISKEWSVYVRKQKILLHEAQGKFLLQ